MNSFLKPLTLFILLLSAPLFCACGDDDNEEQPIENVDVSTYILGKWYTYKATANNGQQSMTQSISKEGNLSDAYLEVEFETGGKATFCSWGYEDDIKTWKTESGTYSVNGNMVIISIDSGTPTLSFDQKVRELYLVGYVTDEYGGTFPEYIYFKKR